MQHMRRGVYVCMRGDRCCIDRLASSKSFGRRPPTPATRAIFLSRREIELGSSAPRDEPLALLCRQPLEERSAKKACCLIVAFLSHVGECVR